LTLNCDNTLTYELDVIRNKYLDQKSFRSKVILQADTQTEPKDCTIWTVDHKLVGKNVNNQTRSAKDETCCV